MQEAVEQVQLADRLGIDYALGGGTPLSGRVFALLGIGRLPVRLGSEDQQHPGGIRDSPGDRQLQPPFPNRRNHCHARPAIRWAAWNSASVKVPRAWSCMATVSRQRKSGPCHSRRRKQIANMMVMDPYPGYQGRSFSMPCRNVSAQAAAEAAPRPCGWHAQTAGPLRWPRGMAWGRSPSPSSIPRRHALGRTSTTTSSSRTSAFH